MDDSSRCLLVLLITVFELVVLGLTTPVWSPQQSSTGFGRNIRHLPCLSRRTGETGVCMFAFSCAKANGTHLGTCIDRFYFGSCCKLAEQNEVVAEPLDSNHIVEEFPSLSTENYHISTYQSVNNVKNTTDNPVAHSTTTSRTTPESTTSKPAKKPPTTPKPSVSGTPVYTSKPFTSSKPQTQANTAKPKPSSRPSLKPPSTTGKPSSGSKPFLNTTSSKPPSSKPPPSKPPSSKPPSSKPTSRPPSKPAVSTKPKPSNTTTYAKPGPQKPYNGTITKPSKPSPTKRPTISTSSKPYTHRPVQLTSKPTSKPTSRPKPSSAKPQTKPTTRPVPLVTTTDPNYVKLPVVTAATSQKPPPPSEATTISNEVVQKLPTESPTNASLEHEEESSNVIGPTTSSPLLVTWTTVDEVPVPPLPKPGSTPSSSPVKNETKPVNTTPETTQSSPTWVQVPMSTPNSGHTHTSSPVTDVAKPGTISPVTSTSSIAPSTTPTPQNITESPTTAENTTTSVAVSATTSAPKLNETSPASTANTSPASTANTSASTANTSASTANTSPTSTANTSPTSTANTSSASTTAVPEVTTAVLHNEINTENINMSDYLDVCGRRLFPQSRIVGGDKATFGKWPWQISLRQWRTSTYLHKCGAALLNENWAITAAHCVENVAPSDLLLRLGEHDLSQEDEPYGYQERRVQIVASHPQFDPRTFEYDLALLRFYEPVTFQPNIIPVCVPQDDTNFVGSTAYVTGWGRLYEDGPLPSVLQEVSVPVINNTVCETMYRAAGYIEHIPEIFICAGWKKGGFDSCEGDSGGPMVIQRPDKRWLLAGVISWGIGCAEPNQPGVYTRISEFRGWINQILQF